MGAVRPCRRPPARVVARQQSAPRDAQELWTVSVDGKSARAQRIAHRIAFPAWTPRGEIACVATIEGRSRVTIPCGRTAVRTDPDLDAYGPIAFSPDGAT